MCKALKIIGKSLCGFVLIYGLGFCAGWHWRDTNAEEDYSRGWTDGWKYIKPIEELQKQIGVEPDNIWGPNTQALYDIALGNQFAEWATCSNVRKFDKKMLAKVEKKQNQ